jgi:hypothetical protein
MYPGVLALFILASVLITFGLFLDKLSKIDPPKDDNTMIIVSIFYAISIALGIISLSLGMFLLAKILFTF